MIEGEVNHAIRHGSSTAQAFEVFKIAAMHLRASLDQRLGARIRARKTDHLMAGVDKLRNNCSTDKACSTGYEDTHFDYSFKSIFDWFIFDFLILRSLAWRTLGPSKHRSRRHGQDNGIGIDGPASRKNVAPGKDRRNPNSPGIDFARPDRAKASFMKQTWRPRAICRLRAAPRKRLHEHLFAALAAGG